MLAIGDKVVYPMHGAGVIDSIETRDVMGEEKLYYVLKLPMGKMTVMIPVDNTEGIGLREISSPEQVEQVREVLKSKPSRAPGSWNKRFHANVELLKTGNILEVAAVARNLILQDRRKRISSGERRLLEQAKQIIISELVFALNLTPEETENWIMEQLKDNGF